MSLPAHQPALLSRYPSSHYHTSTAQRSEEHTSELQSRSDLVCRLLLEKKKKNRRKYHFEKWNRNNIDKRTYSMSMCKKNIKFVNKLCMRRTLTETMLEALLVSVTDARY